MHIAAWATRTGPSPGCLDWAGFSSTPDTGNLLVRRPLFVVSGKGVPLELVLAYNSDRRRITSPFGVGWNLTYAMRYVPGRRGNVSIVWGDGRVDLHANIGGTFTPPAGVHMTLSTAGAGVTCCAPSTVSSSASPTRPTAS